MNTNESVTVELVGGAHDGRRTTLARFERAIVIPVAHGVNLSTIESDILQPSDQLLYEFECERNGILYYRLRR